MNQEIYLKRVQDLVASSGSTMAAILRWTQLHAAAANGQFLTVKWFVDTHPWLVKVLDEDGDTPLHMAGTPEIAQYLLLKGKADLFAKNANGRVPSQVVGNWGTATGYLKRVEERLGYLLLMVSITGLPKDLWRELMSFLTQ